MIMTNSRLVKLGDTDLAYDRDCDGLYNYYGYAAYWHPGCAYSAFPD